MLILSRSVKGCDSLDVPDCPYGASDCPKVNELRRMLQENHNELNEVKTTVIELKTTIRNASVVLGILISIFTTLIGVIQL